MVRGIPFETLRQRSPAALAPGGYPRDLVSPGPSGAGWGGWGEEDGFAGALAWPPRGGHLPCQGLTPAKASVGPRVTQLWGQGESGSAPGLQRPGQGRPVPTELMPGEQGASIRHGSRGGAHLCPPDTAFSTPVSITLPVWEKGHSPPHLHLHPSSQAIMTPQMRQQVPDQLSQMPAPGHLFKLTHKPTHSVGK